jgi:hypothetical protein
MVLLEKITLVAFVRLNRPKILSYGGYTKSKKISPEIHKFNL